MLPNVIQIFAVKNYLYDANQRIKIPVENIANISLHFRRCFGHAVLPNAHSGKPCRPKLGSSCNR